MNTKRLLFIIICLFSLPSMAQKAIEVADITLKVSPKDSETVYFGFAKGDKLVLSLEEKEGNELKSIEVSEYPNALKFSAMDVVKISNKQILVLQTGIYAFKLSNTSLSKRICQLKIERIPSAGTSASFSPTVYWRSENDTIYPKEYEKVIVGKRYKSVRVVEPCQQFVNSGSNAYFKGGHSRVAVPVKLPPRTVEWYYVFTSSRSEQEIGKSVKTLNLLSQLSSLVDASGTLGVAISTLFAPPGTDYCDVLLLTEENRKLFLDKVEYKYEAAGSRQNLKNGVVKVTGGANTQYYLGIRNPDTWYGIGVAVEVVAIVEEDIWDIKDKSKLKIEERKVPYLKN